MSESSLSLAYSDFQAAVGYYLGYTRISANWSTDQTNDIDACIQGGLRMFYNPLECGLPRHEWRFMRPTARLLIQPNATLTGASWANSVATLTFAALPVAPPIGGVITVSGLTQSDLVTSAGYNGTYIVTASSTTSVSYALTTNPGAYYTGATPATVSLNDYAAPDDFGGIDGDFTYDPSDIAVNTVKVVNEEVIRHKRQSYITYTARPMLACVAWPKTDGTVGQRAIFQFWPNIDGSYHLTYKYRSLLSKISTTNPYPMGGMTHSETQQACMIAWAERHINDEMNGARWAYMIERMKSSIGAECNGVVPEFYGYNHDRSDLRHIDNLYPRVMNVTYRGVQY